MAKIQDMIKHTNIDQSNQLQSKTPASSIGPADKSASSVTKKLVSKKLAKKSPLVAASSGSSQGACADVCDTINKIVAKRK